MQQRRDVLLIFKETINNATKYAAATVIEIKMQRENGKIRMEIIDNGIGFENAAETSSNGLKNIRSRAASLGGSATIISEKNKGTAVIVEIPAT